MSGLYDAVKVKVSGDLEEGRLSVALLRDGRVVGERVYSGSFQEEARFPASPGEYLLRFQLQGAKGRVRYDWVTTKFAP